MRIENDVKIIVGEYKYSSRIYFIWKYDFRERRREQKKKKQWTKKNKGEGEGKSVYTKRVTKSGGRENKK